VTKRIILIEKRVGKRRIAHIRESECVLPVTRAGVKRGLERVFEGDVKRSASK
jgi:hypothetical protein